MRIPRFLPLSGLLLPAALLLPAGPAAGDDLINEGVPAGMVAFFTGETACPPGWVPSAEAAGRLIVPVVTDSEVGAAVGMPLADQEDRQHQHVYAAQIALPYKSISAAAGDNKSAAAAGGTSWGDKTAQATTGLPFVQLLTCEHP